MIVERLCVIVERLCVIVERLCAIAERLCVIVERLYVIVVRLCVTVERLCLKYHLIALDMKKNCSTYCCASLQKDYPKCILNIRDPGNIPHTGVQYQRNISRAI